MTSNLDIFRKEFLQANTWVQRKDGIPLDLLDNLTDGELKAAETELIEVLYYLKNFKDNRITKLHHGYRNHNDYLVAYNATRYLGLSTDKIVEEFRDKKIYGTDY